MQGPAGTISGRMCNGTEEELWGIKVIYLQDIAAVFTSVYIWNPVVFFFCALEVTEIGEVIYT